MVGGRGCHSRAELGLLPEVPVARRQSIRHDLPLNRGAAERARESLSTHLTRQPKRVSVGSRKKVTHRREERLRDVYSSGPTNGRATTGRRPSSKSVFAFAFQKGSCGRSPHRLRGRAFLPRPGQGGARLPYIYASPLGGARALLRSHDRLSSRARNEAAMFTTLLFFMRRTPGRAG